MKVGITDHHNTKFSRYDRKNLGHAYAKDNSQRKQRNPNRGTFFRLYQREITTNFFVTYGFAAELFNRPV